jgi:hypothetical protein
MDEPVTTMKHPHAADEDTTTQQLRTWRDTAFTAALDKYHATHDNIETILQTGEAFGRALYHTHIPNTHDWDLDDLCTEITTLLTPLGDSFEITGGQHDMIATFLRRNPLTSNPQEKPLDSLFTYATIRGLFLSAFPQGELVITPRPSDHDHPGSLIFKLHPSSLDRLTRERVKDAYTVLNHHEQP